MPGQSLELFANSFDRSTLEARRLQAEEQRMAFVARFPRAAFHELSLDEYVGPDGVMEWLEVKTPLLGDVGSRRSSLEDLEALKGTGLDQNDIEDWQTAAQRWIPLRSALAASLDKAVEGQWLEAGTQNNSGNTVPAIKRNKLLYLYQPESFLPIYRTKMVNGMLADLGLPLRESNWSPLRNRDLLEHLHSMPQLQGWSTWELAALLNAWAAGGDPPVVNPPLNLKIAPGGNARFWNECLQNGYICVGWDDVGDLRAIDSLEALDARFNEVWPRERGADRRKNRNKAREVWRLRTLKAGDRVIANQGKSRILGVGTVTDKGYEYDMTRPEHRHVVHVTWDTSYARTIPKQELWAFVTVAPLSEEQHRLIFEQPTSPTSTPTMLHEALNRILHGPPGTGKTYSIIREAADIVSKDEFSDGEAKSVYDAAVRAGRVRLVTFHQSFGYEDFIEGIRPVMDAESGGARFQVRDGVFKEIATEALFACLEQIADMAPGFDERWAALLMQIEAADNALKIPGLQEGTEYTLRITPRGNLDVELQTGTVLLGSRRKLERIYAVCGTKQRINSGEAAKADGVSGHHNANAAVFNFMQTLSPVDNRSTTLSEAERKDVVLDYLNEGPASGWQLRADKIYPPHVLIIDEINRGNISRIFGELITLVEEDKRHGGENALQVTLPASREVFAVPPNLFLLGTMNTADKSLALLDVALRRRFEFQELPPDFEKCPALPDEMRLVLERLNDRIEMRKDRDHRIGHAFFMNVSGAASFDRAFVRKVVPLLQEYFFNDVEGALFVLGEAGRSDGGAGFLRPIQSGSAEAKWQRNRWRWFTDEESDMACWERLRITLGSALS